MEFKDAMNIFWALFFISIIILAFISNKPAKEIINLKNEIAELNYKLSDCQNKIHCLEPIYKDGYWYCDIDNIEMNYE